MTISSLRSLDLAAPASGAGPKAPARPASRQADAAPGFLQCRDIEKSFGATTVLAGISIAVKRGEFVSLLGPSGCGKTTLLRMIAGLARPDRGQILLANADLTRVPSHRRNIGVVFQSYALFPHLTVSQNVGFGLKARRMTRARIAAGVTRALQMVRLADLADRPINMLSGGQQQRVAVARALAMEPQLLLLDEPFSALDRKLREGMQIELRQLLRELGITALFVTHDQDEAFVMSDRIALMNRGEIAQCDTPDSIYARPLTPFALTFVGQSSMLHGRIRSTHSGVVEVETAAGIVRAEGSYLGGSRVTIGVRPEHVRPIDGASEGGLDANRISARLVDRVYKGSKVQLIFSAARDERLICETSPLDAARHEPGATITLGWPVKSTLLFPEAGNPAAT
ncbi:MAG: ABC transporter ATP-binding protein [Hyphomicrobiaceae bacterium]